MIELGGIPIRDERAIVEARIKIRILAEDLNFGSIAATRLATISSEMSRWVVAADKASSIEVGLDKRGGAFGLALLFPSGQTRAAVSIKTLNRIFDEVEEFQTADGLQSIKTFKFLPDSEFEPTEEFISIAKELVQRHTKEELYAQLREAYDQLTASNRELQREIEKRKRADEALKDYSELLEEMVGERTTELRDAQEELVRKEKLAVLGQLAAGVGHELRNPLGVISNAVYYLETILSDADETTKEYLELISSEVRTSEMIVSDLLDLSRTRPAERERIEVFELITQILDRRNPPEGVEVDTQITPDLRPLFVDPRQTVLVFDNLITNAYQAMTEGGKLTIQAKTEEDRVHVSITDTGCGIPKENMKKLFEPLFTTKARGIGLGLAVSKNLVEANTGSIEVVSEEDKGSTFTIILPTKVAVS